MTRQDATTLRVVIEELWWEHRLTKHRPTVVLSKKKGFNTLAKNIGIQTGQSKNLKNSNKGFFGHSQPLFFRHLSSYFWFTYEINLSTLKISFISVYMNPNNDIE